MSKKKKQRPDPQTLGLPRMGADSHAHLDMEAMANDLEDVLERARRAGVARIGNVFLGPDAYDKGKDLFAAVDEVFFVCGIHPHDAETCTEEALVRLEQAFDSDPRLRALGEIGLDFYRDWCPEQAQHKALAMQLELARQKDLRVVIHSRDADHAVIAALLDMGFKDRPVLWHCFGGGPERAWELLENGWDISIPGTVTYPGNTPLQEAAAMIPLDRMLVETDCPYLTPVPYRGKRNEPALTVFTAACIAGLRGVPAEEVWARTGETTVRFFGLDE